jgi:uncharacterized protein YdgA (DUF945 family)
MPNPDGSLPTPAEIEMQQQAQLSFVLLALTAQGMLVDTGETYTTSIRLENGEATANGQLIPLGL